MGRRRYLSTNISTDPRVLRLREECGDFAALLYTWLIPHAGDDRSLPSDPEEMLLLVVPGFRDKSPDDIRRAVDAMVDLGLLCRDDGLKFPESFYRYQAYIGEGRRQQQRKVAQPPSIKEAALESAQNGANQRIAPEVAQNRASSSLKSSFSFSSSVNEEDSASADAAPLARARPRVKAHGENLAPIFDAFAEHELSVGLLRELGTEQKAASSLIRSGVPPGDLADCWGDIRAGQYGDQYARENLSFAFLASHNHIGNWQEWRDSGRPSQERTHGSNGHARGGGASSAGPDTELYREQERRDQERQAAYAATAAADTA